MSDRGVMFIPTQIAEDLNSLKTESIEQSIENLYLVDFFYWPRSRFEGAGGITLPLPESEGQVDVERIFRNMRFVKVYNELSKIDNDKASKLITDEINETLPLYLQMFSDSWDKVFKAHENESPDQRQTIGPSLQISDDPNGTPTLAGVRYKLLSLVAMAGNLKLESTKSAIAKVVSEALAQKEKFYDPNTGFSGDRFSMLTKAGLYNRQVLATGILLVPWTQKPATNNSENWDTIDLASFYNSVSSRQGINQMNSINAKFHKPLSDEEFDKICKEQNIKISENKALETQENKQKANIEIVSVPNQDVLSLSADQIIEILNRIGFTKSQIEKNAYEIRDGLARSGAVRIMTDNIAEIGIAVLGDEVYISSRSRGMHIYNINTGWLNTPGLR